MRQIRLCLEKDFTMTQTKVSNDNTPGLFNRLTNWVQTSSARSALSRLDDHSLGQIGITRSEINDYVRSWSDKSEQDNVA